MTEPGALVDSPAERAPEEETSLRALARLAAEGDSLATTRLLQQVAPRMMRVVRAVMGAHGAEADDVVQQALIGLVQALPAFRGECEPASYACRIAIRTAVTARRRSRVSHLRNDAEANADDVASPSLGPCEAASAQRRKEILRGLLEELPLEQAEALAMRVVVGWSIEEIAASSSTPINTVRSRLRLAKEALRRKIESNPAMLDELGVGQ